MKKRGVTLILRIGFPSESSCISEALMDKKTTIEVTNKVPPRIIEILLVALIYSS